MTSSAPSKLAQLRELSVVVADTGDYDAIKRLKPVDCTTNPTLVKKALDLPVYADLIDEALAWARGQDGDHTALVDEIADRLTIGVGAKLSALVPGRVSTEVDADLAHDTAATIAKAHKFIAMYAERGIPKDRILIKVAATWEGIEAARQLQQDGIDCNLTLIFNRTQALACAEAGVFLISPFVGRIYDWYKKAEGRDYEGAEDPGVKSVTRIYQYYKANGYETVVMGASFRNLNQIEQLAGCDRLTISPELLQQLSEAQGDLPRVLTDDSKGGEPKQQLNEAAFRWAHNEDAMATEKLAEGIRQFARDQEKLEVLLPGKR